MRILLIVLADITALKFKYLNDLLVANIRKVALNLSWAGIAGLLNYVLFFDYLVT